MKKHSQLHIIIIFFILSAVSLFSFQNCGNVNVQTLQVPPQPSIQAKGISGKICTSTKPVTTASRYELNHFVIVNMTAVTKNSTIEPDSNVNGVADRIESNLSDIATIKISNTDTDSDGIPDFIEEIRGMSQSLEDLYVEGTDQDGLFNYEELVQGSDPTSAAPPPELNLYTIAEISKDSGCDVSQKTYQFNIQNLQRVSLAPLNDTVNLNETSLNHDQDENVYLIYAHLVPERITEPEKKLFKIFKIKKNDTEFFLDLNIGDYAELPAP